MNLRSMSLGIESFREPMPTISIEEEAILIEGAAQDLAEAQSTQAEVGRVEDIVDGLEDLAAVADRIEEAAPADVAMVDTAQRLALAGSDIESEEVTPSLEGFVGRRISTEGIKELAAKLWDNLKRFLKKIWDKVESFFYKIFGQIPNLRKSLEDLKKRADGTSGKSIKEAKTELGSEANGVSVNYVAPKKAADLKEGFNVLKPIADYVFDKYHTEVADYGNALADAIEAYEIGKGNAGLTGICDKVAVDLRPCLKALSLNKFNDKRFATNDVKKSPDLFGNKAVFLLGGVKREKYSTDSKEVLSRAEAIRGTRLDVMMSQAKDKDGIDKATVDTFTAADIDELVNQCQSLLDIVEEFKRGKGKAAALKARERLTKASDKLSADGKKADDMTAAEIAYYRSAVNFNSWFTGVANQPSGSLAALILTAIRSTIVICNKSLSNYA